MTDDRTAAADARQPDLPRDTDGRGRENQLADRPRDPNEEAVTDAFEGRGGEERGPDAIDLEDMNGASRREPGR